MFVIAAARALSVHVPPIQRVADVSELIEDLSDGPDAPREERRAIRDAARQSAVVLTWFYGAGPRSPDSGHSSRSEARLMP